MTFNPLGKFVPDAPISPAVLAEGIRFFGNLPTLPSGTILRGYDHWTVGHYGQDFSEYNGAVRYSNGHFYLDVVHDPSDNAIGVNLNDPAYHTYRRNTGAFGLATDDMVFADEHNFGPEPLTLMTLEYLCAGNAAVAAKYGIELNVNGLSRGGPYGGEPTFLTHAEAADRPGTPPQYAPYGPAHTVERWDLATFVPLPDGVEVTAEMATICGTAIRTRSHLYKVELNKKVYL